VTGGCDAGCRIPAAEAETAVPLLVENPRTRRRGHDLDHLPVRPGVGQTVDFVNAVLDAVIAISKGGTGGVPALIEQIFQTLARPVNKAIDWVIDKLVGLVRKLWNRIKSKLRGGDDSPRGKKARLDAAMASALAAPRRFRGRGVAAALLRPVLSAILGRNFRGPNEPS